MKEIKLLAIMLIAFYGCTTDIDVDNSIEGVYQGQLSLTKSVETGQDLEGSAQAEIIVLDSNYIEMHCYGANFDTTINFNYFHHNDSILVCLNGENFESTYGHHYGGGPHGMMGGNQMYSGTGWQRHLQREHNEDDRHFGGFDPGNHSFRYSFEMHQNNEPFQLTFSGKKNINH